jgi:hypothetical protein
MNAQEPNWLELARLSQESFNSRRNWEWKIAFGFWTAIGAFTAGSFSPEIVLSQGAQIGIWVFYTILLLIYWAFCLRPISVAHDIDKRFFLYFSQRAEGLNPPRPNPLDSSSDQKRLFGKSWWQVGQGIFTAVLLVLSALLIHNLSAHRMAEKASSPAAVKAPAPSTPSKT